MPSKQTRVTLIHHPTVALKISGFTDPEFEELSQAGGYLGNIYRKIIPPSFPRVAAVLEKSDPDVSAEILDLRIVGSEVEESLRSINWEGYNIDVVRVGGHFELADEAIDGSDWLGISSHFTYESGVIRDLIQYAKRRKPSVKVMVGGADVKARPSEYLAMGADLAFTDDFDPEAFREYREGDRTSPVGPKVLSPHRHPFPDLIDPAFEKLPYLDQYHDSHDGPVPEGVGYPIGFIYFTRGCPRECDFCESRLTKFESLDLQSALRQIEHYDRAGIHTVNFADDNLLLMAAKKTGRDELLTIFAEMRKRRFAWEFPNGLEIGRLVNQDGQVDEELMTAMFTHERDPRDGRLVGAYRVYIPVETFDNRQDYRKLKSVELQNRVIGWIARSGIPEMDFGVVLPPSADAETFDHTREGYLNLREIVSAGGGTKARYSVFHLIPISLFRSMPTKYTVEEFPEGWNFYFPVYDGTHFSARELFERRLRLMREVDYSNFVGMTRGEYGYG